MMTTLSEKLNMHRLVRAAVTISILPLWMQLALLHFRGSFHSHFMWFPTLGLPVTFVVSLVSLLRPDEAKSRQSFRMPALFATFEGIAGTLLHLRGVGRQMGGYYNWRYNVMTGPPFPAPAQLGLISAAGVAAASEDLSDEQLEQVTDGTNALGYLLLALFAGWNHWEGYFFNKIMFIPVTLGPLMSLLHMGNLFKVRLARKLKAPLSALSMMAGILGFGMHIFHIVRRRDGFRNQRGKIAWRNLFYGPPLLAPLLMMAYGMIGLATSLSRRSE